MKNQASLWLIKQRTSQNLSLRQLGAKAKLSHVTIANAEDGNATTDTWIKLAEYFGESPQLVLSWANVLPAMSERGELENEVVHIFEQIPTEDGKRIALRLLKALLGDHEVRGAKKSVK